MRSLSLNYIAVFSLCVFSLPALADTELEQLRSDMKVLMEAVEKLNQRVDELESENKALKEHQQSTPVPVAIAPAPTTVSPTKSQGSFNPDIGVVFDFVGTATEQEPEDFEEDEGFDRFSVREIELNIGHDIDPYTRFDSTITFSDFEDVAIEEAYVTYARLPWEMSSKLGRFRLPVGLSNPHHRDQLYSVDVPLVIRRYLGVEGLSRTGVEANRYFSGFSDNLTHQLRIGMVEGGIGEDGTLFGDSRQSPTYFARLGNEIPISPKGTLDIGGTFLAGSSDDKSSTDVNAYGLDAQYTHNYGPFNTLTLQAEMLLQDRDEALTDEAEDNPWGYYLLADYRASQRWGVGGRLDFAEVADYDPFDPDDPDLEDDERAYSAWITFHQSEFARWRLQYQRSELPDGLNDDQLMIQGTFVVGWHQHGIK